jgi:fructokinase
MSEGGVILVAGEALYDLVAEGPTTLEAHPGGGPFNTARTIARLEAPVAFLSRVSRDGFGERLVELLGADGVRLDAVVRTEEPTTLAIADVDGEGVARYRFYTRGTAAAGLTAGEALAALPADVSALHVGTLGLVLEPTASALAAVVERLAGDALVALDPNCRPSAVPDPVAYRARLETFLASTDVLKLSEEDAFWLEPRRPPVEAARALLRGDRAVALLTHGAGGASVVTRDAAVAVPAPAARVVDTIGAGDAFCGGFLALWRRAGLHRADLARLDALRDATRFACMVAARTCERAGAAPPALSEVHASRASRAAAGVVRSA